MTTGVSSKRVLGTETEYGISALGEPVGEELHPMQMSNHVVKAYGGLSGREAGWDWESETPLRDVRGYEVGRPDAHPDQLTDTDLGMANVILTNGARLYVDHAHPEYASPEVTTVADLVRYDKAGDTIMAIAAQQASRQLGRPIRLYKNNTDGKGASYGTHENYLLDRRTPFEHVITDFTPFLVTRQIFTGAGRVGIGQNSDLAGYQLSQRADFFEAEVGLETTLNRPIINTRDEPHADAGRYRRLHVITGDANLSEISCYLKAGTAALALHVIEAGTLGDDLRLHRPVETMQQISHDPTCTTVLTLADGRRMTAIDIQEAYLMACRKWVESAEPGRDGSAEQIAEWQDILAWWQHVLDSLRTDPFRLADQLDWVAKLALLNSYVERDGLSWDAAKLSLIDLQYADVDPRRGLHQKLVANQKMRRLVTDDEVERARVVPPEDTRAYFRGRIMEKFSSAVVAASWDSVILDVPGRSTLQRIPLLDPLRGTKEQVEQLLDDSADAAELFAALGNS